MERTKKVEFKLYLGRNITLADGSIQEVADSDISDFIKDVAGPVLKNLTVMSGLGIWEGEIERSVIIVFIGTDDNRQMVKEIAGLYKLIYSQQAVYMTETRIMTEVI